VLQLILTPDLRIVDASDEYLRATPPQRVERIRAGVGAPPIFRHFFPGERAAVTGIYASAHLRENEMFPTCRRCKGEVHYRLLVRLSPVTRIRDSRADDFR
jgi:hypothetical protein